MFVKDALLNRLERIYMQWRGIGKIMFIPILANYIVMPCSIFLLSQKADQYDVADLAWNQVVLFIPLMSVWWIVLVLEKCINVNGEIFHLYESKKWLDVIFYFFLYMILSCPAAVFLMTQWEDEFDAAFFVEMAARCFFSVCLVYMLCYVTKSIVLSFVSILGFHLFIDGRLLTILERFRLENTISVMGYLVTGVLCFLIGVTYQKSD